jgi:glycosyltransferase involved in cell wall biosynthesis
MSFSLCLASLIPLQRSANGYLTLDQWAMDLEVQLQQASRLVLVCRVIDQAPPDWKFALPLPAGIEVVDIESLDGDEAAAAQLLRQFEVVQIPSNQTWHELTRMRRLQRIARREGVKVLVAISSNRARTVLLNAAAQDPLRRARARLRSWDIAATLRRMSAFADGAFGVGEGLRPLFSTRCPSVHIGMSSWIRRAEIENLASLHEATAFAARRARLCTASRLERMKGVHMAIDAFAHHLQEHPAGFTLTVLGDGPERAALQKQAAAMGAPGRIVFTGKLSYADEFPAALRRHEMVLFSNLNDEQPRAVFDAIAAGSIPICPRIDTYTVMGLPEPLYYARGDERGLAEAVLRVDALADRRPLLAALRQVVERFTFESMHEERARWIEHDILQRTIV